MPLCSSHSVATSSISPSPSGFKPPCKHASLGPHDFNQDCAWSRKRLKSSALACLLGDLSWMITTIAWRRDWPSRGLTCASHLWTAGLSLFWRHTANLAHLFISHLYLSAHRMKTTRLYAGEHAICCWQLSNCYPVLDLLRSTSLPRWPDGHRASSVRFLTSASDVRYLHFASDALQPLARQ